MALKNLRHEKFCNEIMIDGKTNKQAYLDTYPDASEKTAETNSSQLLSLTKIRERCLSILSMTTGLRVQDILSNLKDLTQANKKLVVDKILKDVPDNQARTSANAMLLRLMGLMDSRTSPTIDARQVHFTIESREDIGRMESIVKRLEQLDVRDDKISGER